MSFSHCLALGLQRSKLAWFPLLDSINSGIIQSFFAYRAFLLMKRNWFVPIIIGVSPPRSERLRTDEQALILTSSVMPWAYYQISPPASPRP